MLASKQWPRVGQPRSHREPSSRQLTKSLAYPGDPSHHVAVGHHRSDLGAGSRTCASSLAGICCGHRDLGGTKDRIRRSRRFFPTASSAAAVISTGFSRVPAEGRRRARQAEDLLRPPRAAALEPDGARPPAGRSAPSRSGDAKGGQLWPWPIAPHSPSTSCRSTAA